MKPETTAFGYNIEIASLNRTLLGAKAKCLNVFSPFRSWEKIK